MTDEIVTTALQLWGLDHAPCELAAARENQVFKLHTAEGPLALRLHRPHYRSHAEIVSEMQWMAILSKGGLPLPQPRPSLQGELCEKLGDTHISVVSWLEGRPMSQADLAGQPEQANPACYQLGQCMARLHCLSDQWTVPEEFSRPAWSIDGLLGETPLWGRFWENPQLTDSEAKLLQAARETAREYLTKESPHLDYGLIHADLVPENVLLHEGRPQLIDFDDGGYGFRLFDLATTLNRVCREDTSGSLAEAVLAGYQSERSIDTACLALFRAVRSYTYLGWIIERLHEHGADERCQRYKSAALGWAEQLL